MIPESRADARMVESLSTGSDLFRIACYRHLV